MTPHRFVPVSLPLDAPEDTPTTWRCVGCSLVRSEPSPRLTDDCKAEALPL